jgi:hypothetical protein
LPQEAADLVLVFQSLPLLSRVAIYVSNKIAAEFFAVLIEFRTAITIPAEQ